MTDPRDRELDDFLRRDSALTRAYRELDDEAVPPMLDARVRAEARKAVKPPRRTQWLPLAAAAVLVLAVGITLRMREQPATTAGAPVLAAKVDDAGSASVAAVAADTAAPAPLPEAAPPPAAPPPVAQAPAAVASRSMGAVAAESATAEAADIAAAPVPALARAAEKRAHAAATPARSRDEWLKDIEALRAAGRLEEAEAEAARYREAYPDAPPP
jgi:hypothetical protein